MELKVRQPGASSYVDRSALTGTNFYRSPLRVGLLMFFAPVFHQAWWFWQLFKFTKREGFPRTRAFWWVLVPNRG